MLAAGISRQDIIDVVRAMQYQTLFDLCYQLSDSSSAVYPSAGLPRADWGSMQVDEEGQPRGTIESLHESVLRLDPTGREMRPR
jgi:hypothetical protein